MSSEKSVAEPMGTESTHVLAEYRGCPPAVLDDPEVIERAMRQAAVAADATIVQTAFHRFSPQGVSGVVVVEESHFSIHTWPEKGYAAVDFFTCGECLPEVAERVLAAALGASRIEVMRVDRGRGTDERMMRVAYHRERDPRPEGQIERRPDRYFAESLTPWFGYFYTVKSSILHTRTPHQTLSILDTEEFGRVMLLDGATQVVEKNDWLYHEPMVHPALVTHPDPRDVCVIGGGDGGAMREVLKHRPARAVQCDIDAAVMDACELHLPSVNQGAFRHPSVERVVSDGRLYIESTDALFDVVIMDMTDPVGPSRRLYTQGFFEAVRDRLRGDDGLFVMHCESPVSRPVAYQQILHTLSAVWSHQHVFYVYVQMYSTLWAIVVNGDTDAVATIDPDEIARRLEVRGVGGLKVYTPATHHSMQVGYPFIDVIRAGASATPKITDANTVFADEPEANGPDGALRVIEVPDDTA